MPADRVGVHTSEEVGGILGDGSGGVTLSVSGNPSWINSAPDALSRYPVSDPQAKEMLAECDSDNEHGASIAEVRAMSSSPQESVRLQGLRTHAQDDRT